MKINNLAKELAELKANQQRCSEVEEMKKEYLSLSSKGYSEAVQVELNSLITAIEAKSLNH